MSETIIRPMTEEDLAELMRAENLPGARIDPSLIPPAILEGLKNYAGMGKPVGGFLEAVLSNDLMTAFHAADAYSRVGMASRLAYIYNDMPSQCHGSVECYRAGIGMHKAVRDHGEDSQEACDAWTDCNVMKARAHDWSRGKLN